MLTISHLFKKPQYVMETMIQIRNHLIHQTTSEHQNKGKHGSLMHYTTGYRYVATRQETAKNRDRKTDNTVEVQVCPHIHR
jgi:hypothetical protein